MHKLLIVDDEAYILDWLYALLKENETLDLDIYTALTGSKALEIINMARIDIVLTDINMPGMNGLQLLKSLRSSWPRCKVIFLTGMMNFEYIYEASQHEDVAYLLKTEKDEVIIAAVQKALRELEDSVKLERILGESRRLLEEARPLLQREYMLSMLYGGCDAGDMANQFRQLDIALDPARPVQMTLCSIRHIPPGATYVERNRLIYTVKLLMKQQLPGGYAGFQLDDDQLQIIWFLQEDGTVESEEETACLSAEKSGIRMKGALEKIQDICVNSLQLHVSFVMSGESVSWEEVSEKYLQLKSNLLSSAKTGDEIILFQNGRKASDAPVGLDGEEYEQVRRACIKLEQMRILENYLDSGQMEQFSKQLGELAGCLREVKTRDFLPAVQLYNSIALIFLSHINKRNLSDKIPAGADIRKLADAYVHGTWADAVDYLYAIRDMLFSLQVAPEKQAAAGVKHIKDYIDANLDKDLSLVRLADQFHFNSTYLSRLFKAGTDMNLSDYIFNARIELGKRYLKENRLKVHEIAITVGYDSPKSFARLFKKSQGVTPQEYRDSFLYRNNMSIPDTESKEL